MKKFPYITLLILIWVLISSTAHAYSRIISLKPNITEILFALGVGDKVVGVTTFCDRPKQATALPKVADYIRVNPEQALAQRPDLIIGSEENSSQKEVFFLMDRGIRVKLFSFATIADTLDSIEKIGKLVGRETQAQRISAKMEASLEALKKKSQGLKAKRVLFVVGHQPLMVAGSKNFFDDATAYLGIQNVAHQSRLKYPSFTTERVIQAAPEVILDMIGMESGDKKKARQDHLKWWQRFSSLPAVRTGQIYPFDIEKMRAVPELPQALGELFELIHGGQES